MKIKKIKNFQTVSFVLFRLPSEILLTQNRKTNLFVFNMRESGSDTDLFRYIEKEGIVKDLNVHGRTIPSGSAPECKSFVVIAYGTERIGAVAGYSGFDGEIKNNAFVDSGSGYNYSDNDQEKRMI